MIFQSFLDASMMRSIFKNSSNMGKKFSNKEKLLVLFAKNPLSKGIHPKNKFLDTYPTLRFKSMQMHARWTFSSILFLMHLPVISSKD